MKTLLWLVAGVILGAIIHIVVILSLPALASNTVWSRIAALGPLNKAIVLNVPAPGSPNPLQLDPKLTYAVCRVNLAAGPAVVSGTMPDAFWSHAILHQAGTVI